MKTGKGVNRLEITRDPSNDEIELVYAGLSHYNSKKTQGMMKDSRKEIFLTLKDNQGGVMGGIFCFSVLNNLNIQILWIDERYRRMGYGKNLVLEAEKIAKENGCISSQTFSYSFQAPEFYQKLGYEIFGVIEDYPLGIKKFFLRKKFQSLIV